MREKKMYTKFISVKKIVHKKNSRKILPKKIIKKINAQNSLGKK